MNWRHKNFANYKTSSQSKYFFSEREIDFNAEYFDYGQFLIQEFFNTDLETREKLSSYYINEYGSRAFAYLDRKYSEWANGKYHLTDLMKERIIAIMPKFLNEKSKNDLIFYEFNSLIKRTIKTFQYNQGKTFTNTVHLKLPQEITSIFETEYKKIQDLTIAHYKFNFLSDEEKEDALKISKNILEIKLQNVFNRIERDFKVFLPFMFNVKIGVFSAFYSSKDFNLKFDLRNALVDQMRIPEFKVPAIENCDRIKMLSNKYLADEIHFEKNESTEKESSIIFDAEGISLFFSSFEELSTNQREVSINATFKGEGGVLILKAEFKSWKSRVLFYFNKIKYLFLVVALILAPRIFEGLTQPENLLSEYLHDKYPAIKSSTIDVDVLTDYIREESRYKYSGSICRDGTISFSQGRGSCSWHGGVLCKFYEGQYSRSLDDCKQDAITIINQLRNEALEKSWRD